MFRKTTRKDEELLTANRFSNYWRYLVTQSHPVAAPTHVLDRAIRQTFPHSGWVFPTFCFRPLLPASKKSRNANSLLEGPLALMSLDATPRTRLQGRAFYREPLQPLRGSSPFLFPFPYFYGCRSFFPINPFFPSSRRTLCYSVFLSPLFYLRDADKTYRQILGCPDGVEQMSRCPLFHFFLFRFSLRRFVRIPRKPVQPGMDPGWSFLPMDGSCFEWFLSSSPCLFGGEPTFWQRRQHFCFVVRFHGRNILLLFMISDPRS